MTALSNHPNISSKPILLFYGEDETPAKNNRKMGPLILAAVEEFIEREGMLNPPMRGSLFREGKIHYPNVSKLSIFISHDRGALAKQNEIDRGVARNAAWWFMKGALILKDINTKDRTLEALERQINSCYSTHTLMPVSSSYLLGASSCSYYVGSKTSRYRVRQDNAIHTLEDLVIYNA